MPDLLQRRDGGGGGGGQPRLVPARVRQERAQAVPAHVGRAPGVDLKAALMPILPRRMGRGPRQRPRSSARHRRGARGGGACSGERGVARGRCAARRGSEWGCPNAHSPPRPLPKLPRQPNVRHATTRHPTSQRAALTLPSPCHCRPHHDHARPLTQLRRALPLSRLPPASRALRRLLRLGHASSGARIEKRRQTNPDPKLN